MKWWAIGIALKVTWVIGLAIFKVVNYYDFGFECSQRNTPFVKHVDIYIGYHNCWPFKGWGFQTCLSLSASCIQCLAVLISFFTTGSLQFRRSLTRSCNWTTRRSTILKAKRSMSQSLIYGAQHSLSFYLNNRVFLMYRLTVAPPLFDV